MPASKSLPIRLQSSSIEWISLARSTWDSLRSIHVHRQSDRSEAGPPRRSTLPGSTKKSQRQLCTAHGMTKWSRRARCFWTSRRSRSWLIPVSTASWMRAASLPTRSMRSVIRRILRIRNARISSRDGCTRGPKAPASSPSSEISGENGLATQAKSLLSIARIRTLALLRYPHDHVRERLHALSWHTTYCEIVWVTPSNYDVVVLDNRGAGLILKSVEDTVGDENVEPGVIALVVNLDLNRCDTVGIYGSLASHG